MTDPKPTNTPEKTPSRLVPKKRYVTFYFTMLVISGVLALSSISTITDVFKLIAYYPNDPAFALVMLFDAFAVAVAGVGLILLFQKRRLGLLLTLGSLAVQFVIGCIGLFFMDQLIAYYFAMTTSVDIPAEDIHTYISFMRVVLYVVIPVALAATAALAILWYFAWKKQYRADRTSK